MSIDLSRIDTRRILPDEDASCTPTATFSSSREPLLERLLDVALGAELTRLTRPEHFIALRTIAPGFPGTLRDLFDTALTIST